MNKILYISLLTICFAFPSCDNFLDIVPTGEVIPETVDEYRALMNGAYSKVPDDKSLITFRTDETSLSTADNTSLDSYKDIWTWNDINTSEYTLTFKWLAYYNTIYVANQIIENQDRMKGGTKELVDQLVGEAYLLRAYAHFNLVNVYATHYNAATAETDKGVPIKTSTNPDEVLGRSSVAKVYKQVIDDVKEAESRMNVDSWEVGKNYRFTTVALEAFKSRLYMYMGEGHWLESLNASKEVLKKKSTLVDLNKATAVLPNQFTSEESIVALEQNVTASTVQAITVSKALLDLYKTGDLRKSKYYKAQTASIYTVLKGGNSGYKCTFRVGEAYLNAAEASYHLQDLVGAKNYLLPLLEKRYNPSRFATLKPEVEAMDGTTFIAFLYEERFRELAFEGHRWFDLRRTTQPRIEKELKGITYVLEQGDSRYTIKIPREAIANNPNLAN